MTLHDTMTKYCTIIDMFFASNTQFFLSIFNFDFDLHPWDFLSYLSYEA
jgi:hypothetical protein